MSEKVQKIIASRGLASRREAEKLIEEGKVLVNGKIATIGDRANENDKIVIDGKPLYKEEKVYYILNKPRSVVSTCNDEHGRKTLIDYVNTDKRIYPVGRLDYDSEGLLLLTNDGELMNNLLHPSHEVRKVYLAKVSNLVNENEIRRLQSGVMVDGKLTSPAKVVFLRKEAFASVLLITIHEGRNRQVRKMVIYYSCT